MQLCGGIRAVGGLSVGGGCQPTALPRAPMLDQDVRTLLAAGPAGIGQWGQAPGITAPHVHPVLQEKAHSQLAYVGGKASAPRDGERQPLKAE